MINTIKKRSAKELYEIFLSDYKKFNYILNYELKNYHHRPYFKSNR